ncbi:MAG: M48 family metallopeptidase [Candidatus Babeliaceae bacterium]|nr:M48 family metallopeptidase [Candidatus Babeliaceae bacterium]
MRKNIALSILIFFLVGCATTPITMRRQLLLVPNDELIALSATSYNEILQNSTRASSTTDEQMVTRVGQRIAAAAEDFMRENGMQEELKNYNWEFNLIEDQQVNAFCLPGGKIAVYTGILPVTQSETGLAVVVGHEVAHALANHGGERLSQELIVQLGASAISDAYTKNPTKTKAALFQVYGIGSQVGVLLPYSRLQESEADTIGLILMARAGYDPHEAPRLWERMSALEKERGLEFLSTHPAPNTRIEKIKQDLPKALEYYKA